MTFGYLEPIEDVPFWFLDEAQDTIDAVTVASDTATNALATATLAKTTATSAATDATAAVVAANNAQVAATQCLADAATSQSLVDQGETAAADGTAKAITATNDLALTQADITSLTTSLGNTDVAGATTDVANADTAVTTAEANVTSAEDDVTAATAVANTTKYYSWGNLNAQTVTKVLGNSTVTVDLAFTVKGGNVTTSSDTFTLPEGKVFRVRVILRGKTDPVGGYIATIGISMGGVVSTSADCRVSGVGTDYTKGSVVEAIYDTTGLSEAQRTVRIRCTLAGSSAVIATFSVATSSTYILQEI